MAALVQALLLAVAAAALTWSLVGVYAAAMTRSGKLEAPGARSMHTTPVPTGAGLGIVAAILISWPWWRVPAGAIEPALLGGMAGLGALSWLDDRRRLSAGVRLGAQATAVALCLAVLPPEARVLEWLPLFIERCLLAIAWIWFINLFNFMDGIDGLAGSETIAVAGGFAAMAACAAAAPDPYWRLALVTAASAIGYLAWNWHPARVFMGDAGSIPLGFVLGWLMLNLALGGQWAAGLILPLVFLADATCTLMGRAWRGEKPWQAHRQHFYQRAVLGGATPTGVVWRVIAVNVALLGLALASMHHPLPALAVAVALVAALLAHLEVLASRRTQHS
jgi:UDP-N-acetylmuramyl pentapeptide phosphotransferase/UDP-N-acetylglucosamine-1-phosphate transferase